MELLKMTFSIAIGNTLSLLGRMALVSEVALYCRRV